MSINRFPFEGQMPAVRSLKRKIGVRAANMARKHFDASFKNQGFTDRTLRRWKPSQRARRTGDKTLSDTGRLRRSIKPTMVSFRRSKIQTVGVRYARRHNEGIRTVKRKFMGDSEKLRKQTAKMIAKEFLKVFVS